MIYNSDEIRNSFRIQLDIYIYQRQVLVTGDPIAETCVLAGMGTGVVTRLVVKP